MTPQDEPLLGLATTRELLQEIEARGRVSFVLENGNVTGREPFFTYEESLREEMADEAERFLAILPDSVLDYRTVDS